MNTRILLSGLLSCLWLAIGCTQQPVEHQNMGPGESIAAKSDQWGALDDPARLNKNLVYELEALPLQGEAEQIPWPGSYWPTYQDSINHKWDGPESTPASVKFGQAFGIENFDDEVSSIWGIDRYAHRKECTTSADCGGEGSCGIRDGETKGRCIPGWWGICHAWAPAALKEPEPRYPVTRNGVTFKVNDIKALMTLAYHYIEDKHISLRCESTNGVDMAVDPYGNPTGDDIGCKDTNPGTFHVVATNYLGLMNKSFVEDRTYDFQVWNQPVARYNITHQERVTIAEAHQMLNVPENHVTEEYLFNPEAKALYHVKMELDYIVESHSSTDGYLGDDMDKYTRTDYYQYILEVDADGKIFGGEWVGSSKTNHPDFLWVPTYIKTNGHWEPPISYWLVKSLLEESLTPPADVAPEPTEFDDTNQPVETEEDGLFDMDDTGAYEEAEEETSYENEDEDEFDFVDEEEGDEEEDEDEEDYDYWDFI